MIDFSFGEAVTTLHRLSKQLDVATNGQSAEDTYKDIYIRTVVDSCGVEHLVLQKEDGNIFKRAFNWCKRFWNKDFYLLFAEDLSTHTLQPTRTARKLLSLQSVILLYGADETLLKNEVNNLRYDYGSGFGDVIADEAVKKIESSCEKLNKILNRILNQKQQKEVAKAEEITAFFNKLFIPRWSPQPVPVSDAVQQTRLKLLVQAIENGSLEKITPLIGLIDPNRRAPDGRTYIVKFITEIVESNRPWLLMPFLELPKSYYEGQFTSGDAKIPVLEALFSTALVHDTWQDITWREVGRRIFIKDLVDFGAKRDSLFFFHRDRAVLSQTQSLASGLMNYSCTESAMRSLLQEYNGHLPEDRRNYILRSIWSDICTLSNLDVVLFLMERPVLLHLLVQGDKAHILEALNDNSQRLFETIFTSALERVYYDIALMMLKNNFVDFLRKDSKLTWMNEYGKTITLSESYNSSLIERMSLRHKLQLLVNLRERGQIQTYLSQAIIISSHLNYYGHESIFTLINILKSFDKNALQKVLFSVSEEKTVCTLGCLLQDLPAMSRATLFDFLQESDPELQMLDSEGRNWKHYRSGYGYDFEPIPDISQVVLNGQENLWPKDVGYNTRCGYKVYTYDSEKDPIQKVGHLVESWKKTVLEHRFDSLVVKNLLCKLSVQDEHELTFISEADPSKSESKTIRCKVQNLNVSIDIDEDPEDTVVQLLINGKNIETGNDFKYDISVYRHPEIRTFVKYSE